MGLCSNACTSGQHYFNKCFHQSPAAVLLPHDIIFKIPSQYDPHSALHLMPRSDKDSPCTPSSLLPEHCALCTCRCLCIPQVLYKTAAVALDEGLDVLGLLHTCHKTQPGFQTQWASAQPTACPYINFGLDAADLALQLGPEPVLESAKGRPAWAFSHMLQFGEIMQVLNRDMESIWNQVLGSRFANYMFLVIILMPPLFFIAHHGLLMPFSAEYRGLPAAERLVVCEHAVYVFVFGVSLIPQTLLAFTALFKAWTGWYLQSAQLAALFGIFIASRAVLYAVEASVRSVIKWSWLLLVHHQLFFLIVLLAMWGRNATAAGLGVVLDLFACHEAPLYAALVSYRLRWPPRFTQAVLRFAVVWYLLTRIFQTVVLGYMIVGFAGMPGVKHTPAFIVTAVLCGVLTVIQAYTLVIYLAIDRKVSASIREGKGATGGSGSAMLPVVKPGQTYCGSQGVGDKGSLGDVRGELCKCPDGVCDSRTSSSVSDRTSVRQHSVDMAVVC